MYSIRSTLILLGIIALVLLVLVGALLFRQVPRTVSPAEEPGRKAPLATTSISVTPASTTETTENILPKPASSATEIGSDFNMEFPTLDE